MEIVQNPHDKMFKRVFRVRENAVSLLSNILPAEIREKLDLEGICFENDSYVPPDFTEYFSDLLTSIPVADADDEVRVYFLFEHKSTNYPDTPLQLLRYMLEIWQQHRNTTGDYISKLPAIIPVVVSHPRSAWKVKRITDLVNIPAGSFTAYIPDFDYLLYDSTREDPEAYDFNEAVKALLTIWHYSHRPEFMDALSRVFHMIRKLDPGVQLRDFLGLVMQYLYIVRGENEYIDIEKIARDVIPEEEEYMGTIAEMLERKGREEGVVIGEQRGEQRGKLETAQEMLIDFASEKYGPLPVTLESEIRSIQSATRLKTLGRQILKLDTLEDFAALIKKALER